jgi:predicted trehalose synthase
MRAKPLSDKVEGVLASLDDKSIIGSETINDFISRWHSHLVKEVSCHVQLLSSAAINRVYRYQKAAVECIRRHENHQECQSIAGQLRRLIAIS